MDNAISLKHLVYAASICLLSYRVRSPGQVALDLDEKVNRMRLKINSSETEVLSLVDHRTLALCINGHQLVALVPLVVARTR